MSTTHAYADQSGHYTYTVNLFVGTFTVAHDGMTTTLIMHTRTPARPHDWQIVDNDLSLGDGDTIAYRGTVYALTVSE